MKTNYNNLTTFEACIVIVAIAGLTLIGWEIYMSLPHHSQTKAVDILSMFDMHEEFVHVQNGVSFAMDSMDEFYNQFDIAFEQTFSYPDQIGSPVIKFAKAIDAYSSELAFNYQQNIQAEQAYNPVAMIGTMIAPPSAEVSGSSITKVEIYKEYYYHAPGVVKNILK